MLVINVNSKITSKFTIILCVGGNIEHSIAIHVVKLFCRNQNICNFNMVLNESFAKF